MPNRGTLEVTHVAVSETLCDVASVHAARRPHAPSPERAPPSRGADGADDDGDSYEKDASYKYKSLIRVHTCNARFVGETHKFRFFFT